MVRGNQGKKVYGGNDLPKSQVITESINGCEFTSETTAVTTLRKTVCAIHLLRIK